jgi:VanZ family protein
MRLSGFRTILEKKTIAATCFGILCAMIVAAFWPFTLHPTNHVAWLSDENGLRFNGGGIILSPKNFEFAGSQSPAGASLELWLEPSQDKYSTALLSFSSPVNPERFRLRQSHDFLLVLQESFASSRHIAMTWLWIPHVFQAHKRRFIVITSGVQGTTVYLDGVPAETSSTFKLGSEDFSGQLILGASPTAYDTWRGKLLGLALFGRELTSAQVLERYHAWLNGRAEEVKSDQPAAIYTFAERSGSVAHNQVVSGPDLAIPVSFSVPYKPFLKLPWREFYPNQAYLRDVLINIAGFVPLGFFFCMLFSSSEANRKVVIATIILGAIFSLTIEVLQGFIPMRDSGTTDIITNTLGTTLGALLYREGTLKVLHGWLESRMVRNADLERP